MSDQFKEKKKLPSDSFVQSFARGLDVIKTFNRQRPEQTLTEVAQSAGLARASARRILLTLEHLGYVERSDRKFRLTPQILDLGFAYLNSTPFWNLAEPVVEQLSLQTSESTSLAVLDGTDVVYILRVPAKKIMTVTLAIGSRLPALWTSLGRVLLAEKSDNELKFLLKNTVFTEQPTKKTLLDKQELFVAIQQVREQGWCIVEQELEVGLVSMAAPVRDHSGKVIAAINISGHAQRTSAEEMKNNFLGFLLAASRQISTLI